MRARAGLSLPSAAGAITSIAFSPRPSANVAVNCPPSIGSGRSTPFTLSTASGAAFSAEPVTVTIRSVVQPDRGAVIFTDGAELRRRASVQAITAAEAYHRYGGGMNCWQEVMPS